MRPLTIVFMGSPDFALPSLKLINSSLHILSGLVTQPDRRRGRGGQLCHTPVKQWGLENRVEVFQPPAAGSEELLKWLKIKSPDLIVTVAFGNILPAEILNLPPCGCINLHASYLPAYRGAAPIHRAVIEGALYSGVSVIEMTTELDAGNIILQEKEEISLLDTAGSLHDRLAERGALLLVKAINAIAEGTASSTPQDSCLYTYASPLKREDEKLDWNRSAIQIYNCIRGLNPWPGAYTTCAGKRIKVWKAALPEQPYGITESQQPGTILAVGEQMLTVAAGKGIITLLDLQPAGKKTMDAGSFCCGYRIEPGMRLDDGV